MVATAHRQEFRDQVDDFIRKVIQHRQLLITRGSSIQNELRCKNIMAHLKNELNAVNFTNKGMAKFFLDNLDDIKYLVNQNDVNKHNTLNQLLHKTEDYYKAEQQKLDI